MKVDFDDRAVYLNWENYDFAIRITAKVEDAVVAQKIGCAQLRLCASPFYLKRKEEPKHLNDLNNQGVAVLPDFLVDHAIASGKLFSLLPHLSVPDYGIYLVHANERRLIRRMRLFSEEMKAAG